MISKEDVHLPIAMRDEACELTEEDINTLYERAKSIQADIGKVLSSECNPVMVVENESW